MAIIQSFPTKRVARATVSATLERDDNSGRLFVRVLAARAGETKEKRISIGAEDGKDQLPTLSPAEVQTRMQTDLDQARQELAQLFAAEQKVIDVAKDVT